MRNQKTPLDRYEHPYRKYKPLFVPTFPTTHQPNSMLRMIPGHHDFVTDRMRGLPLNVPSHRRGDVLLLMPYCGNLDVSKGAFDYRYDHEISKPYFYSVFYDYEIEARFAPMKKSAIYSFALKKKITPK